MASTSSPPSGTLPPLDDPSEIATSNMPFHGYGQSAYFSEECRDMNCDFAPAKHTHRSGDTAYHVQHPDRPVVPGHRNDGPLDLSWILGGGITTGRGSYYFGNPKGRMQLLFTSVAERIVTSSRTQSMPGPFKAATDYLTNFKNRAEIFATKNIGRLLDMTDEVSSQVENRTITSLVSESEMEIRRSEYNKHQACIHAKMETLGFPLPARKYSWENLQNPITAKIKQMKAETNGSTGQNSTTGDQKNNEKGTKYAPNWTDPNHGVSRLESRVRGLDGTEEEVSQEALPSISTAAGSSEHASGKTSRKVSSYLSNEEKQLNGLDKTRLTTGTEQCQKVVAQDGGPEAAAAQPSQLFSSHLARDYPPFF